MKTTAALTFLIAGLSIGATSAAPMHVIVKDGLLFGATASGKWIASGPASKHVKGGEHYKIYGFDSQLGAGIGSKPGPADQHCPETISADIKGGPDDTHAIAIDAPWNAIPRKPHTADVKPADTKVVVDYIKAHGHRHNPKIEVTQVIHANLDGKGDTTIITATYDVKGTKFYVVLARRNSITIPLLGDVAHEVDFAQFPTNATVKGVYDFKGNGKEEILIDAGYQDSAMSYIYDIKGNKAKTVLTSGCSS